MDALLGKDTDTAVAQVLGTTFDSIRTRRRRLGIAPFTPKKEPLKEVIAKLGALPRPAALPVDPLQRQFDVHLPTARRRNEIAPTWPDTEDKELTAWLEAHLAEILSKSRKPPACAYCHSWRTRLAGVQGPKPCFYCHDCKNHFNRATNTPLANLRNCKLMPAFIRQLSQQIPLMEASRRLNLADSTMTNWTKRFRKWILMLDPSGKWEARVRLGMRPHIYIPCPRCGDDGEKMRGNLDEKIGRHLRCLNCASIFSVEDAERLAQEKVRMEVVHDGTKVVTSKEST